MLPARQSHPTPSDGQFTIETIDSVDRLSSLREPWNDLVRHSPQNIPFLTYEWLRTWWDAFGGSAEPQVITVWRGEHLMGIAPMAYRRILINGVPCRVGKFWSNPFSNRVHLVTRDPANGVVDAIVDYWLAQEPAWDQLHLEPVPLACPLTHALVHAFERRNVAFGVRESLRSPYLTLPATWDEFMAGLSSRFRKSLRQQMRAARSGGKLRVTVANSADAVETAFEIASKGRFHEDGTSIAATEAQRRFYNDLAKVAFDRGWLVLGFLEHEGQPIAYEYNLYYDGIMYALKSGYDPDFAEHSPGRVLMHEMLRKVISVGGREYDCLGMDEDYKLRWTKDIRTHGRITVFSDRFVPRAQHFLSYRMQPWVKHNFPWAVKARRVARGWLSARQQGDGDGNGNGR